MKTVNIGVANLIISDILRENYFLNEDNSSSNVNEVVSNFINLIKESPILQLQFKVFENLENKNIDNDVLATRYIDNNIKLFEVYTLDEVLNENKKISELINLNESKENTNSDKFKLYNSIGILIEESLKPSDEIDVDSIHESFNYVLNHLKKDKKPQEENIMEGVNEDVVEIALDKYNEKYSSLSESEKDLIKTLIKATQEEKKELFEEYKKDNIQLLNNENELNEEVVKKTINRINEMKYNIETVDDNIVDLYDLKKGLLS